MKQIKAFIRESKADEVVRALEGAGAPGVTVSCEHGLGYGYEPAAFTLAPGELRKAPRIIKIEVVCAEDDVDRLLQAIAQVAHTGTEGDGIVFITPVERVVRIRTGAEGREALKV